MLSILLCAQAPPSVKFTEPLNDGIYHALDELHNGLPVYENRFVDEVTHNETKYVLEYSSARGEWQVKDAGEKGNEDATFCRALSKDPVRLPHELGAAVMWQGRESGPDFMDVVGLTLNQVISDCFFYDLSFLIYQILTVFDFLIFRLLTVTLRHLAGVKYQMLHWWRW